MFVRDVTGTPAVKAEPYKLPETFTPEQQAIIDSTERLVVGQALAGTGKSTTGLGYAASRPNERILVLCFNRANAKEAQVKYPAVCKNATVKTVHAVAFDALDRELRSRVAARWTSLVVRNDLVHLGLRPDMRTAAITTSILIDFFNTADESISAARHSDSAQDRHQASFQEIERCTNYAKRLWGAMQSVEPVAGMTLDTNPVTIPHDAYLKMFALSKKNLGFDTIIFDEAQDANPVMLRVLHEQYAAGAKLLFLGDAHQSIYDFRGAINGMLPENMPTEPAIYPLTQSWRMGPRGASLANLLLKDLKNEPLRIQAMGKDTEFDVDAPRAYLARRNATLIAKAVTLQGEGICWVGGIGSYRVDMLLDAWHLHEGNKKDIQDYLIKRMRDYVEFAEAAKYDPEMKVVAKLVDDYKEQIPSIVNQLRKNAVDTQSEAQYIFTTAHRAKGLEWDYVELAEDFEGALEDAEYWLRGDVGDFPEQEINLLYVASTRAKKALKINKDVYEWLSHLDNHRSYRNRVWQGENDVRETGQRQQAGFAGLAPFSM